jgi:hypothetical protein
MAGIRFFRKIVPIALAGAAALVMVIPMSASAGDLNHHDQIAHRVSLARHRNWFGGWHHFHTAAPANVPVDWPQAVIPAAPAYGAAAVPTYSTPYGAGAYGTEYGPCANLTRLQNVCRRNRATGHPLAPNNVARQMRVAGNRHWGLAFDSSQRRLRIWAAWLGVRAPDG